MEQKGRTQNRRVEHGLKSLSSVSDGKVSEMGGNESDLELGEVEGVVREDEASEIEREMLFENAKHGLHPGESKE